ncbi:MAG: hypothetical protein GX666_13050, partial [Tissierellia bacterium]|nr:hypothetical protein [Tissierellia bacterium]
MLIKFLICNKYKLYNIILQKEEIVMAMPVELIYLFVLLITIVIVFVFYKRPIYEAMFVGFLVMVVALGRFDRMLFYMIKPATN